MHFGKSHLEDKREDLRSHYGKIEKTAGVTALRIAFCLLLVVLVCGAGLVIGAVRGVRISRAKELLISRPYTTLDGIAALCGYRDVSYFISVFRQQTGTTPKQFRKLYGI